MGPKLVLSYDSNSGPGAFGLGWSLIGTSAITVAVKNRKIDRKMGPVTFDGTDTLSLDGARLVRLSGHNNLLSKAIDDQTLIEEIGSAQGPYYVARTKAGLRMYFGALPNSAADFRVRTGSGKIIAWPCVRVEDTLHRAFVTYVFIESLGEGRHGASPVRCPGGGATREQPDCRFDESASWIITDVE
jgi:Salmonella virulence plasmid 65kDa B protein